MGVSLSNANLGAAVQEVAWQSPGQAVGLAIAALYGAQSSFPFVAADIDRLAGPSSVFAVFGISAMAIGIAYGLAGLQARRQRPI
jgi:hypothetical protein